MSPSGFRTKTPSHCHLALRRYVRLCVPSSRPSRLRAAGEGRSSIDRCQPGGRSIGSSSSVSAVAACYPAATRCRQAEIDHPPANHSAGPPIPKAPQPTLPAGSRNRARCFCNGSALKAATPIDGHERVPSFLTATPTELVVLSVLAHTVSSAQYRGVNVDRWGHSVNDDVEAFAGFRRHEITCDQIVLFLAYLERMFATRISFPQPLLADRIGNVEYAKLVGRAGFIDQRAHPVAIANSVCREIQNDGRPGRRMSIICGPMAARSRAE